MLFVPPADLAQKEREIAEGVEWAGHTADTIQRIIEQCPIVTIDNIDEYGQPWFSVEITNDDGQKEEHWLAIMEHESWAHVRNKSEQSSSSRA